MDIYYSIQLWFKAKDYHHWLVWDLLFVVWIFDCIYNHWVNDQLNWDIKLEVHSIKPNILVSQFFTVNHFILFFNSDHCSLTDLDLCKKNSTCNSSCVSTLQWLRISDDWLMFVSSSFGLITNLHQWIIPEWIDYGRMLFVEV